MEEPSLKTICDTLNSILDRYRARDKSSQEPQTGVLHTATSFMSNLSNIATGVRDTSKLAVTVGTVWWNGHNKTLKYTFTLLKTLFKIGGYAPVYKNDTCFAKIVYDHIYQQDVVNFDTNAACEEYYKCISENNNAMSINQAYCKCLCAVDDLLKQGLNDNPENQQYPKLHHIFQTYSQSDWDYLNKSDTTSIDYPKNGVYTGAFIKDNKSIVIENFEALVNTTNAYISDYYYTTVLTNDEQLDNKIGETFSNDVNTDTKPKSLRDRFRNVFRKKTQEKTDVQNNPSDKKGFVSFDQFAEPTTNPEPTYTTTVEGVVESFIKRTLPIYNKNSMVITRRDNNETSQMGGGNPDGPDGFVSNCISFYLPGTETLLTSVIKIFLLLLDIKKEVINADGEVLNILDRDIHTTLRVVMKNGISLIRLVSSYLYMRFFNNNKLEDIKHKLYNICSSIGTILVVAKHPYELNPGKGGAFYTMLSKLNEFYGKQQIENITNVNKAVLKYNRSTFAMDPEKVTAFELFLKSMISIDTFLCTQVKLEEDDKLMRIALTYSSKGYQQVFYKPSSDSKLEFNPRSLYTLVKITEEYALYRLTEDVYLHCAS